MMRTVCRLRFVFDVAFSFSFTGDTDVWAFGVLMWEMYTGMRAYQGKTSANIMYIVTANKGRIELPEDCPPRYKVREARYHHIFFLFIVIIITRPHPRHNHHHP